MAHDLLVSDGRSSSPVRRLLTQSNREDGAAAEGAGDAYADASSIVPTLVPGNVHLVLLRLGQEPFQQPAET